MRLFRNRRPLPYQWKADEPDHEARERQERDRVYWDVANAATAVPASRYFVQANAVTAAGDAIRADVDRIMMDNMAGMYVQAVAVAPADIDADGQAAPPDMLILDDVEAAPIEEL